MPVKKAKKPKNFNEKVRNPGLRAIAEMAGKISPYPRTAGHPYKQIATRKADIPAEKFPSYWIAVLDDLTGR